VGVPQVLIRLLAKPFSAAAAFCGKERPTPAFTYQSVCQTADPGGALRTAARERLLTQRAEATGAAIESVRIEVDGFSGGAAERFEREVAAEIARLKRAVAHGDDLGVALSALVAPSARERIDALRAAGVRTLMLDECHHLASLWGYLVRAVIAALGDVYVVGLTATSPSASPAAAPIVANPWMAPSSRATIVAGESPDRPKVYRAGRSLARNPSR
jgi:hypothetical protein